MHYDVTALGELLIDFTPAGDSPQGNPLLEANPGGAPCNVLAMLQKLGHTTAFLGKVGNDGFGDQLEEALRSCGIATAGLKRDEKVHTTLAFVHKKPDGDRTFSFYRDPGADMMLSPSDLDMDLATGCTIFHFGSLSMTAEPSRAATRAAVTAARSAGRVISFDPNLRESLWTTLDDARDQILWGLGMCDLLKISDNEIVWLTGETDYDAGVSWIRQRFPQIRLILVSMGKDGSRAFSGGTVVTEPSFLLPNTIETTGAGDTFCACVLHFVLEEGLRDYTEKELHAVLRFANAAAAVITTRKGAMRVMPDRAQIDALLKSRI